jgi:hypothetical protein
VQANCPSCSHKIVIDDARVPDRPFSVKCPKCQKAVRFPGKGAAPRPVPVVATPPPAPAAAAPAPAPETEVDDASPAPAHRRAPTGVVEMPKTGEKALVALPDDRQAGIITVTLSRAGYEVETLDDWEEATRILDRSTYDIVVTTHAASAKGGYSPYQKIVRMPAEVRRNLCLIVVGDDVTTGDAAQAYKLQADLGIQSADLHDAGMEIREVVFDRKRVYQAYLDALRRLEGEV